MARKINIGAPADGKSPFSRIISEISATYIPANYIERLIVTYKDGSVIEMTGDEIDFPVPINQKIDSKRLHSHYRNVQEVKVFLKMQKLEHDINAIIIDKLGKYFQK